jgi:hypothetical protein
VLPVLATLMAQPTFLLPVRKRRQRAAQALRACPAQPRRAQVEQRAERQRERPAQPGRAQAQLMSTPVLLLALLLRTPMLRRRPWPLQRAQALTASPALETRAMPAQQEPTRARARAARLTPAPCASLGCSSLP